MEICNNSRKKPQELFPFCSYYGLFGSSGVRKIEEPTYSLKVTPAMFEMSILYCIL